MAWFTSPTLGGQGLKLPPGPFLPYKGPRPQQQTYQPPVLSGADETQRQKKRTNASTTIATQPPSTPGRPARSLLGL